MSVSTNERLVALCQGYLRDNLISSFADINDLDLLEPEEALILGLVEILGYAPDPERLPEIHEDEGVGC